MSQADNRDHTAELQNSLSANVTTHDFGSLIELVQAQQERLDALQSSFDSKFKYDLYKEKVIDSLHRELQVYRDDLAFKFLRPILLDLITAYDDLDSILRHVRSQQVCCESEGLLRRNVETFLPVIEDILYRNGVEVFSEDSTGLSAQRQRSIKIIETNVREQDRMIAERIRKGFSYGGKTLRPELVATYKYTTSRESDRIEGR